MRKPEISEKELLAKAMQSGGPFIELMTEYRCAIMEI